MIPLNLDSLKSVRGVPGVGEKTAEKLVDHFGSEKEALEAIRNGDVISLSNVNGMTPNEASKLVRNAINLEYGAGDFLKTESLSDIYEKIFGMIKERARTEYGAAILNLCFPTASERRIEEVRSWVSEVMNIRVTGCLDPLEKVRPLEGGPRIDAGDRILLTGDLDELERINEEHPDVPVDLIEDYRELREYVEEYDTVFVSGDNYSGPYLESESVEYLPNGLEDPIEVFPELVLSRYIENAESIDSAIEVLENVEAPFLRVDGKRLEQLRELLSDLGSEGGVKGFEEIDRLEMALERLGDVVEEAEDSANERIEEIFNELEVTIRGEELRDLIERGGEARDLIYSEVGDEVGDIIDDAVSFVVSELDLDYDEKELAQEVFSHELELPLEADRKAVERLRDELGRKHSWESLEVKVDYARRLKEFEEDVEDLIAKALNLDSALAVKEFSEANDMVLPEISGEGLGFERGLNLLMEDPEPVDYEVNGVRILTGVNSGGKTSLLDMISQIYILFHMGFPVPAREASVELVDEIYYYRDIKRTMSSGALENILRRFEELFRSEGSKLVLVDELENITEPGASAKIVSGILDVLEEEGSLAVFVSHLADRVLENTEVEIPVDGIEPEGLDEDMNLVVDRTPKRNLLATSTPELIVEKLAAQGDSRFYDKLMGKFEEDSDYGAE
ncbi:MAG: MutS-related protein [Candidatus Hadarchaeota archaeon]